MTYSVGFKNSAVRLRKRGYSIKEIAKKLKVVQSTASLWVRDVVLDKKALVRLEQRSLLSRYKTSERWKQKRQEVWNLAELKAARVLEGVVLDKDTSKLLCALLFWAEGAKTGNRVIFTNSDPKMVRVFLQLFRRCFPINEDKFRALLHVHGYHDEAKLKKFWSDVTEIPLTQFNRSYRKPHTGKRKRVDYKGCIAVRYGDVEIARELKAVYNIFAG